MTSPSDATAFLPSERSFAALRTAVQQCRGCDLYKNATHAVFGEIGVPRNRGDGLPTVMMVGEQPGDREDIEGRPFVGPAGRLLDECLHEAGIKREQVYITNAVKHFKWELRGKRRLHKKPTLREVKACRPWLDAEMEAIDPKLIVCLGATAAQSLLGPTFKVTMRRGELIRKAGFPLLMATVHPSSILRARTDRDRGKEKEDFIADLRKIRHHLEAAQSK
jgi:uracil-DNA glycosylase family protein